MTDGSRQDLLNAWDEELLLGGVTLSEWATFLVESADLAFCAGADIAALLTAQAAMETHLRHETSHAGTFVAVIDASDLPAAAKVRLHEVRRYRNRWVHVNDPGDDESLLNDPGEVLTELAEMATRSMRLLREVIYSNQWV